MQLAKMSEEAGALLQYGEKGVKSKVWRSV